MEGIIRKFLLLLICSSTFLHAQVLNVNYQLKAGNSTIYLGDSFLANGNWYRLDECKFYAGVLPISTHKKSKFDWRLIDFSNPESLNQRYRFAKKLDKILFGFGVDSITQVSSIFKADLDPIHGMYWTWQSGYIQLKIECTALGSKLPENHAVQLHIGGFMSPHKSNFVDTLDLQKLLPLGTDSLRVVFDVAGFLAGVQVARIADAKANNLVLQGADLLSFRIMSPSKWSNIAVKVWRNNIVIKALPTAVESQDLGD